MPGAAFKRNAYAIRPSVDKMLSEPFETVKRAMVKALAISGCSQCVHVYSQKLGSAAPSFTSYLLDAYARGPDGKINPQDEYDIQGAAGVLYGGV